MPCCYVYMPLLYGFERSVRWIVTALEYCKARRENMAWSRCARRHLTWQHLESGGGLWWCLAAWSRGCKHADILSSWSRSWLGVDMHIRSYIRCPCAVFFPPFLSQLSWSHGSRHTAGVRSLSSVHFPNESWTCLSVGRVDGRLDLLVQWLISSLVNASIPLAGLLTCCYIW